MGNIIGWVKDFADMLMCFVLYPKFRKLKAGAAVYSGNAEFTFQGLNFWGLADGLLPQYSVVLERDNSFGDFSPRAVSLERK